MATKQEINYFKILGLDEDASKEDVKRAYKKLAKEFHPDAHKNVEEKNLAEKQFKVIKKAYDLVMENIDNGSSKNKENLFDDIDFLKFFANKNCDLQLQKENVSLPKAAIKFMEEQIQKFNIDMRFVFNCIEKEKMFILWDVDKKEELKKILIKEVAYRQYIKESPLYSTYIKNKRIFNKPDVILNIKINPKFQERFEEKVFFNIYKVCDNCHGQGCSECHLGLINSRVSKIVKFSHIQDDSHYKINNLGNKLEIINGNLLINFTLDDKIPKWSIKQKNSNNDIAAQTKKLYLSSKDLVLNYCRWVYDFATNHKIHIIYSSIIFILLILFIIICAIFI